MLFTFVLLFLPIRYCMTVKEHDSREKSYCYTIIQRFISLSCYASFHFHFSPAWKNPTWPNRLPWTPSLVRPLPVLRGSPLLLFRSTEPPEVSWDFLFGGSSHKRSQAKQHLGHSSLSYVGLWIERARGRGQAVPDKWSQVQFPPYTSVFFSLPKLHQCGLFTFLPTSMILCSQN